MNTVARKPSAGAGRFSKSMDGWCSVTSRENGPANALSSAHRSRRQLLGILPRKDRVEHRILGLDDRRIGEVDGKRRVVFGVFGVPLGLSQVPLGLLVLDVL